jgi:LPXTG-motif cell wall-anchored protein
VKPTLAALTAGAALTVGGAIWLNRRRKLGA